MQDVAREMNLSETAFLHWEGGSGRSGSAGSRPTVEVDLCGHATLAAAHVLWTEGHLPAESPAWFQTRSGLLTAAPRGDWIELDFPATPVQLLPGSLTDSDALAAVARRAGEVRGLQPVRLPGRAGVGGGRPGRSRPTWRGSPRCRSAA